MGNSLKIKLTLLFIALAIILGAFGAHILKSKLDPYHLEIFKTGQFYHFVGTIGLLGILLLAEIKNIDIKNVFWLQFAGIICFSFSLYFLSISPISFFHNFLWLLGPITPIGGLLMIISWVILAFKF